MDPVDGNAIAGELFAHFGREMTRARGTCGHCGARGQIAELVVYTCAPGSIARCPRCGKVLIVLVAIREHRLVHHDHFELDRR
jgi:ribosomal protein S27AE